MCEPVTLIGAGLSAAGQIAESNAQSAAVSRANRAKLRNYEEKQRLYDLDVMFDRAQYKNDTALADIEQDQVYQSLVDQWTEEDFKLDQLFAEHDHKIEKAMVKMYENDYAGTQTGKTAARLAGKSAKEFGREKSEALSNLMMSKKEAALNKDRIKNKHVAKSREIYESVRFAPVHGVTPRQPELEPQPSKAGLILGLASTGLGAYSDLKDSGHL